jgi:hypothetical protein
VSKHLKVPLQSFSSTPGYLFDPFSPTAKQWVYIARLIPASFSTNITHLSEFGKDYCGRCPLQSVRVDS